MFNADKELMEPDVLDGHTIAQLLNVQESLLGAIDGIKWFLDRTSKTKVSEYSKVLKKSYDDRLFYLEGNLEILNGVMEGKVQNIFEPTIYAEICFN